MYIYQDYVVRFLDDRYAPNTTLTAKIQVAVVRQPMLLRAIIMIMGLLSTHGIRI